jgi:cell wall-associated NlpC family hydrolase
VKYLSVLTLFMLGALLVSPSQCGKAILDTRMQEVTIALEAIQQKHVPDRRISVFDMVSSDDNPGLITVETDNADAAMAVVELLQQTPAWENHVKLVTLPNALLGERTRALVTVSVAHLRRTPRHQAELIDQAIMGTPLTILRQQGAWYYIQTPWQYLGWVTAGSIIRLTEAEIEERWQANSLRYVNEVDISVREDAQPQSTVISDVTLGATVKLINSSGRFSKVELPDGRQGFLPSRILGTLPDIDNLTIPAGSDIVSTAQRFQGLPYIWGGNSGKGFDCSGFTQTVFRHNGFLLPRDANMQVELGEEVSFEDGFTQVQPGDLLYFGGNGRITHVGISLGGARFIHASSYVMMNSLDEADSDYDDYRRRTLVVIKRL